MSGSIEKRFMRKRGPKLASGCMEWMGYLTQAGYGGMSIQIGPNKHTKTTAHRIAYQLHFGKIPEGLDVMHSCDNRRCVNWEHLSLGTPKQNSEDMVRKGRQRKSQFSEADLADIRNMRSRGMTQQEIANNYGVSRPLVSMLLSGKVPGLNTGN
jgi:predicted XRE-type DNA-binding protein